VFNGAMTAGSLIWGFIAQEVGVPLTLLVSAGGLVLAGLLMHRVKLPVGEADLTASNHWPEPLLAEPVAHDRGPVLILIEYTVTSDNKQAFLRALSRLSEERRRDGAYAWGVTEDAADPQKLVEWFMVESWAEHLRQHQRVTQADADLQTGVTRYHTGATPPVVRHFLDIPQKGLRRGNQEEKAR
jgi:quinol monooxygenase YgiN